MELNVEAGNGDVQIKGHIGIGMRFLINLEENM